MLHVPCLVAADLAGQGLGTAHQLGGPLGTAPSMGAKPPVQRSDDYLRDTFAEVMIIQTTQATSDCMTQAISSSLSCFAS